MKAKILVVDDEANITSSLSDILSDEGYEVLTANRAGPGQSLVERESPDLILLDVMLPDVSGLEVLKKVKSSRPETEVVMISGHATVDRAVEAIRAGAYDFLEKPLSLKRVLLTVSRALERRRLALDRQARESAEEERHRIVGASAATRTLLEQIDQVAPTSARVLIIGETGTGKELVAYWIHHLSARRDKPYIKVNCAAIPKELLESEFFGHEKGAFTGAHTRRIGKLELADTGTVLLDEIGDLDQHLQAKLLRVIETGEFERLGASSNLKVDVRLVSATNKNLAEEIRKERFREDLFHRLNAFTITIPPLRERPDDIPVLARRFLDRYCQENGLSPRLLTPDALEHLKRQSFPGNGRELKNLIERAAIVTPGPEISSAALARTLTQQLSPDDDLFTRVRSLSQARNELEKRYLETQLARVGWNITRASSELKVERSNLSRRLKQLGINKPEPYA